jgi:hypothetical protein
LIAAARRSEIDFLARLKSAPKKQTKSKTKKLKRVMKKVPKKQYTNYHALYTKVELESIIEEIVNSEDELEARKEVHGRLGIPMSTLRDWVRKKDQPIPRGMKRRKGGGRKPLLSEKKELQLYNWLMSARAKGAPITAEFFLRYVKRVTKLSDLRRPVHFACTRRWLAGYFRRWNLTLRTGALISPLSLVQGTELDQNIANLWKHCNLLRERYQIADCNVINLDEVPIWFDSSHRLVIDEKGVKRARIRSNGRDKLRMTLILTVCGDGTKLNPLLIFKSLGAHKKVKKKLKRLYAGKMLFATAPKAYSNRHIFLNYLKKLFPVTTVPKLLLFDTSNTHGYSKTQMRVIGPVLDFLKKRKIHVGIIPEHCTGIVQCLDTHVNKSFKSRLKDEWTNFMIRKRLKLSGNGLVIDSLPVARLYLCKFIWRVWKGIPKDMIRKAFRDNGFTLALDGSEEAECRVYSRTF